MNFSHGKVAMEIFPTNHKERAGGKESRRNRRYGCDGFAEAVALDGNFLLRGEILDISQTGCFIKTKAQLHLGRYTKVDLRFTVKETSFHILARVMEVRFGKGAGFEFLHVDPQVRASLLLLIHSLSTGTP
jgi:hypothetical protein